MINIKFSYKFAVQNLMIFLNHKINSDDSRLSYFCIPITVGRYSNNSDGGRPLISHTLLCGFFNLYK